MMKRNFIFILLCFSLNASAQTDLTSGITKYKLNDSLLNLQAPVKMQLLKIYTAKTGNTSNQQLLLRETDKIIVYNTGRWVAARTQRDLYMVKLSSIVSKYIGETEKNLELLFNKAESKNMVLFFDEADALFGQRTKATEETTAAQTYFLQRIANYKGTVIVNCTSEECLNQFAKKYFIRLQ